ncbi:zinc metalloprotease [Tautonia sociabilis]|uniref:Peptidase metallopeptidase domain-containing protein n=1 Tax=Tautonia sociabilis TaxID=2080755 RepID=A0A432MPA5_9BACT|nr:hypothetical protein [Tautonia sociabilis]RUL89264.1 hypothetical protein TsocGM_02265 [Tautonia sociabilis]
MGAEPPSAFPAPCTADFPLDELARGGQARAGALTSTLWDRPRRGALQLNVVFLDGEASVQALVRQHARAWEESANVRFNFLGIERYADAHIRITMPPTRSFHSYLGTGSAQIDRRLPSMTLGFTDDVLAEPKEVRRLVLHEFGHALGLIHEHQNPNGGLKFKEPEVFEYFWRTQRWDERTVREQVIRPARAEELSNASKFDPDSIMLYAFPPSIIAAGPVSATKLNYELSEQDRRTIAALYPKDPTVPSPPDRPEETGVLPLRIGEPSTASIPIRGAEIPFGLLVREPGRYVIETFTPEGAREEFWVMTLLDSDRDVVASDREGSSPHGLNARIECDLEPGRYVLIVRHRLRAGLGSFGVLALRKW